MMFRKIESAARETISKAETTVSEREKERNLAELSIKELAALCVGYGPGTPFAAVGDRSDPSTIFDDEGKPMTTNSHPTGYPDMFHRQLRKKESSPFSIKTALPGLAVLHGQQRCSLRAPLTKNCGRCLEMQ